MKLAAQRLFYIDGRQVKVRDCVRGRAAKRASTHVHGQDARATVYFNAAISFLAVSA